MLAGFGDLHATAVFAQSTMPLTIVCRPIDIHPSGRIIFLTEILSYPFNSKP
jgi:hypothetical protein